MPDFLIPLEWRRCPRISFRQAALLAAGADPDGAPPTAVQDNTAAHYRARIRDALAGLETLIEKEGYSNFATEDVSDTGGELYLLSPEFLERLGAAHLMPTELRSAITTHNLKATQARTDGDIASFKIYLDSLAKKESLASVAEKDSSFDELSPWFAHWVETPIGAWFATYDENSSAHFSGVALQNWISAQARAERPTVVPAPTDALVAGLREFAKTYSLFRIGIFADALEQFVETAVPLDVESYPRGTAFRSKFLPKDSPSYNETDAMTVSSLFLLKNTPPGRLKSTKGAPS